MPVPMIEAELHVAVVGSNDSHALVLGRVLHLIDVRAVAQSTFRQVSRDGVIGDIPLGTGEADDVAQIVSQTRVVPASRCPQPVVVPAAAQSSPPAMPPWKRLTGRTKD